MKDERRNTGGLLSTKPLDDELAYDESIRPRTLEEYIGQESIKKNLKVFLEAALKRGEALDHVLLYGAPGLGKTTLAAIIARELGRNLRSTSGPAIERPIDLIITLKSLKEGDVLFIDEIHRLRRPIEEILYPAMEDFTLDRVMSKGVAARPIKIDIPRFTLIGATTRGGAISSPLRARFGIIFSMGFYEAAHLRQIVSRASRILRVSLEDESAVEIAGRSRGTPRIANRLLRRLRDFAEVKGGGTITITLARHALEQLGIDRHGLDSVDRKLLEILVVKFRGKPVGIETIAASLGEEPENIEEVYEPYLLQLGFIDKTNRGRVATAPAFEYLGVPMPL
ncbi:MAG: Holliday junction branch migration DNA helicase RuvB [Candidatus Eremiobacteraeota bacterium]|nr:Holliday junction branch migration DNA helicase RuvB [Candidatus Eremiobacteraeota bacterium]